MRAGEARQKLSKTRGLQLANEHFEMVLTTTNRVHNLHMVIWVKRILLIAATRNDLHVDLHGDTSPGQPHGVHELCRGVVVWHLGIFAVYFNIHPYSVSACGHARQIGLCFALPVSR